MARRDGDRLLWLVAACVLVSGAASLGLEVVWSRSLKLVFGSTTLAITTILVAYMLGLGLGGLVGGRLLARGRNGVRTYGWMEVLTGLYALSVPAILSLYPALNRALVGNLEFWPAALVRFALVLVVLLLPTVCMGATLPVLAAALARGRLAQRVGLLYGVNTLGAVLGVLGATFVGFPRLGLAGTNAAAALIDVLVGLVAVFVLARRLPAEDGAREPAAPTAPEPGEPFAGRRLVLASYGLVGFVALASEVAWTRALTMVVGSSVYAFATILAGFLAGIALGSLVAQRWLLPLGRPVGTYAGGLALLGVWSLVVVAFLRFLPDLFLSAFASVGIDGARLVWLGLSVSFLVLLGPTLTLGALFPLALRLVARGRVAARAVGEVYFVNTVGSALGAFAAGFLLIPGLGLRRTLGCTAALSLGAAAVLLRRLARPARGRDALALLCAAGALVLVVAPPDYRRSDFRLGAFYRTSAQLDFGLPEIPMPALGEDELVYFEEGVHCNVAVVRSALGLEGGVLSLQVNGKPDASLADTSTQVLAGHLPLAFGGPARRALVIGHASGMTAGTMSLWNLEALDVCEIEPAVVEASRLFDEWNHRPLERPEVRLILDDGRTVLSTSRGRYDVIVSEPSNPWLTGCANLFTAEYFREARAALAPGGRLLQWIQLYGLDAEGVASILAGLLESFDHVYGFLANAASTDLTLIASLEPLGPESMPRWDELPETVRADLARLEIFSTAELWSLMVLGPRDLSAIAERATVVNTDDSMHVELRAPWTLYDETPETARALWAEARGVVPVLEEAGFPWPEPLLGELALATLRLRSVELGAVARSALERRGAAPWVALFDGALATLEERDPEEARRLFDAGVEALPDEFAALLTRGWCANQARRFAEAERDLARALELRPLHLVARHERMKALGELRRMEEARREVEVLLATPLVETRPRLWADGAFLAGGFGDLELAEERTWRYLRLVPHDPAQWELLARWRAGLGDAEGAREATEHAELARANQVRQLLWWARWHEGYGTLEEARLALRAALELAPESAAARADLRRLGG